MTPAQMAAILATVETIPLGDPCLIGWEPKHDALECNDPVLAAMIDANRVYEIPFHVVAVSRRQWQIWEKTNHHEFWAPALNSQSTNAARGAGQTDTETIHNMKKNTTTTNPSERKAMLSQVCDSDSYLPIITACLDEAQMKQLKPRHMANFMAISADLFISNYSMIADAFERNNGLEIGFKAKLAQEKDNVEISFKPVDVFKDSSSLNLPDEDQEEFSFVKKSAPVAPVAAGPVVEAEVLALPAPHEVLALPAPSVERPPEEQVAYDLGFEEFSGLELDLDDNPYDVLDESNLHAAWKSGFETAEVEQREHNISISLRGITKPAELKKKLKAGAGDFEPSVFARILARVYEDERAASDPREWFLKTLQAAIDKTEAA